MLHQDELQITLDHRQWIVQFECDAGKHLAKRRKSVRVAKLLFEPRTFRYFAEEKLISGWPGKIGRSAGRFGHDQTPIFPHQAERTVAEQLKPFPTRLRGGRPFDSAESGQRMLGG